MKPRISLTQLFGADLGAEVAVGAVGVPLLSKRARRLKGQMSSQPRQLVQVFSGLANSIVRVRSDCNNSCISAHAQASFCAEGGE